MGIFSPFFLGYLASIMGKKILNNFLPVLYVKQCLPDRPLPYFNHGLASRLLMYWPRMEMQVQPWMQRARSISWIGIQYLDLVVTCLVATFLCRFWTCGGFFSSKRSSCLFFAITSWLLPKLILVCIYVAMLSMHTNLKWWVHENLVQ
jgi:hypothetical protein